MVELLKNSDDCNDNMTERHVVPLNNPAPFLKINKFTILSTVHQ